MSNIQDIINKFRSKIKQNDELLKKLAQVSNDKKSLDQSDRGPKTERPAGGKG